MPTIRKQSAKKKKPIKRRTVVKSSAPGIKISVYGRGKTGKTRFACTFPKPMVLIGTEDGTRSVCTGKGKMQWKNEMEFYPLLLKGKPTGIDYVSLDDPSQLDNIIDVITGDNYASAALDTAGGMQDLILKVILGLDDIVIEKSWGLASRNDWQACGAQTKQRLRSLLRLNEDHGTNVVIIAHERNFNDDSEGSDLITPTVGSALTPSASGWLNGEVDYLCQCYIRQGFTTVRMGKKTAQKPTGRMEYCLRTGPHPVYLTGFRLPPDTDLPECVVDPTYAKVMEIIGAE